MAVEQTVLPLLVILLVGLIVPEFFKKFRLPFVTSLIIAGAVLGPYGLDYVRSNEVIAFFGYLGVAFLMLMGGLEAKAEHFQGLRKKVGMMAAINGLLPFLVGIAVMRYFGYSWLSSLLIGTIFISSSIAIVITSVKAARLMHKEVGQEIVGAAVVMDVAALLLLAIILQTVSPITQFPLFIYFGILIFSMVVLKMFLPEFAAFFFRRHVRRDKYEGELRFILVILMSVLFYFSGLGVHPIVAAFLVGLLLSDVLKSEEIYTKLHTLGYGLFVPVFFFIVGMGFDIRILAQVDTTHMIIPSLILALILSKLVFGYLAGKMVKLSKQGAKLFSVVSTAQLTTSLAVIFAGSELGLLDKLLTNAVLAIVIITTIAVPIVINVMVKRHGS